MIDDDYPAAAAQTRGVRPGTGRECVEVVRFETQAALADGAADLVEETLRAGIAERGSAGFGASAGSTPAGLYRALAARQLPWDRVKITLVDERWVAPDDDGSNEAFLRMTLLQDHAANASLIGMWSESPSPEVGLETARARLAAAPFPLDAVLLGMGTDAHTASWFPHAAGLDAALAREGPPLAAVVARESEIVGRHRARMTMTLGAIASARRIILLIAGDKKLRAFEAAQRPGPVEDAPVRAILDERPDVLVCWAP